MLLAVKLRCSSTTRGHNALPEPEQLLDRSHHDGGRDARRHHPRSHRRPHRRNPPLPSLELAHAEHLRHHRHHLLAGVGAHLARIDPLQVIIVVLQGLND